MRQFFALLFACAATAQLSTGGSGSAMYFENIQGAHVPEFQLPERFLTTETWVKLAPVRFLKNHGLFFENIAHILSLQKKVF